MKKILGLTIVVGSLVSLHAASPASTTPGAGGKRRFYETVTTADAAAAADEKLPEGTDDGSRADSVSPVKLFRTTHPVEARLVRPFEMCDLAPADEAVEPAIRPISNMHIANIKLSLSMITSKKSAKRSLEGVLNLLEVSLAEQDLATDSENLRTLLGYISLIEIKINDFGSIEQQERFKPLVEQIVTVSNDDAINAVMPGVERSPSF